MKKLLYLFLLFPIFLFAQPRYGVEGIPMCWKIGNVDSNITRYVIISSTGSPVQTIAWENAAGQVINVNGGYLRYGFCECSGSSGSDGNGIYGGSGTLPNALVQVQNTQGIKFVEPGTQNGILIANKANGAAGIALDPVYTDSIRQGLIWKQGADSAAVGIDKDGRLQLLSNNWVAIGNDQAKIIIRKDDAVVLIKTGNSVYALADGVPLSGKNNVMLWPNGSGSGRFANLDSLVDGRLRKDTTVQVLSGNTVVDFDFADTRRYDNVFFVGKGETDTAQVIFLTPPVPDQFKTVFHVKADSGDVALRFTGSQGINNNNLYMLKPGQRAEVRALYDAVAETELWEVVILWDQIFEGEAQNPNVLYVAPYGNDATAQVGAVFKPYKTLGAAVAAATSGNLIYVFPGTYFEPSTNLWKDGVDYYFDHAKVGPSGTASEGFINQAIFRTTADNTKVRVRGTLETYQLVDIRHKNNTFDAEGYLLGQTFISPGANHAKVTVRAHLTPGAFFQYMNTADTVTRNTVSVVADVWSPWSSTATQHAPIAYFNNTSTRSKLNNYNISIGSVHMTGWADFYSNRGIIQCRSVGMAFDSTTLRLNIGKGIFDLTGVNVPNFGLLAFFPFQPSTGNQLFFNCDECILKNRATLANGNVMPENTDLIKITGNFKTYNKIDPFFVSGGNATNNRFIFDGYYYSNDSSLFILGNRANWQFGGIYKTRENDDPLIIANWNNSTSRPLLMNTLFDTPTATAIQSSVATTWYTANARETKTITRDPDISFVEENQYGQIRSYQTVLTASTDTNGDIQVTFPSAFPDATFSAVVTFEDGTSVNGFTRDKLTTGFKVRVRNSTTGAIVPSTSFTVNINATDY